MKERGCESRLISVDCFEGLSSRRELWVTGVLDFLAGVPVFRFLRTRGLEKGKLGVLLLFDGSVGCDEGGSSSLVDSSTVKRAEFLFLSPLKGDIKLSPNTVLAFDDCDGGESSSLVDLEFFFVSPLKGDRSPSPNTMVVPR